MKSDKEVNHPPHYNRGEIECIAAIEDWELGYHLGSAVAYIMRAGHKPDSTLEKDLKKAVWYINRYLEIKK